MVGLQQLRFFNGANYASRFTLCLKVADEKVYDWKIICKLFDYILEQNNADVVNIKIVLAYRVYDSNTNFKYPK